MLNSVAIAFAVVSAATAQPTNAPQSQPGPQQSQTAAASQPPTKMSVFEVSADQDVGYQGGNTTSGSRLNTSLKDTPAAVQVVTKEFMEDFGLNSLDEIAAYATNARVDLTETLENAAPNFSQGTAGNPDIRMIVRGLEASAAADFFENTYPMDSYNTERFEISSGPNSILFGFGNPGGLFNVMTKTANLHRDRTRLRFKFGSWNYQRYELDHNQVVMPDKLAFRLNGMYEDADGWRTNDFKDKWRGAASIRFQPWDRTTIIAKGEVGRLRDHLHLPYTADDQLSLWQASGSPVMDILDWVPAADRARGINRLQAVQIRYVTNADGSEPYLIPTRNANDSRLLVSTFENFQIPTADRAGRTLVHPDVIPLKYSLYGPGSFRHNDINRLMISVEQELTENIVLNLAYDKQGNEHLAEKPQPAQVVLAGDPNPTIPNPDGVGPAIPNPNAGKAFVETVWNAYLGEIDQEIFRAAISGKFDFGKFGTHNVAGMYENANRRVWAYQGRVIFVDNNNVPINNANVPENAANWIRRRHYVTPGDFRTYEAASGVEPITITSDGINYHSRPIIQAIGPGDVERSIETGLLVTQSSFFKDRLVVTGGLRKDKIVFDQHGNARFTATDPEVVSGERIVNERYFTDEIADTFVYKPTSHTLGAVYHINPLLSVFYNTSNSVSQPRFNHLILPDAELPPPSEGDTFDYGFMLDLFDGKLFLRATAYETDQVKKTRIGIGQVRTRSDRILETLLENDLITQAEFEEHSIPDGTFVGTNDELNSGYEVSAWYNPGGNFTAQINYSYTETDKSRIAPEFDGWYEDERAFWFSNPGVGSLTHPETGETIDDIDASIPLFVQQVRDQNNFGFGVRPHKANVSGRYSFSEGRLKGVFVGGGARWQSSALIGRFRLGTDAEGSVIYGDSIYGPEQFLVDGFVGYRTRIEIGGHNPNLTVQLNVTNLTDEDEWQALRYNNHFSGNSRILMVTPRQYRLTVSLDF